MKSPSPFLATSQLDAALDRGLCQQAYLSAMQRVVEGRASAELPESLAAFALPDSARHYGWESLVSDDATIGRIFHGITLSIYQTIEQLYCCRLGRSTRVVWQTLNRMAQSAGADEISYEAVWALCDHLATKRATATTVTCEVCQDPWWAIELRPEVLLQDQQGPSYAPSIVCVGESHPPRVLAFRVVRQEHVQEGLAQALYDALVSQRVPAQAGAAGLCWRVPSQLLSEIEPSQTCRSVCAALSMTLGVGSSQEDSFFEMLRKNWVHDLAGRRLTRAHFRALVDTYLKCLGYSPLRAQREQDRRFLRRRGYAREPIWQFPALYPLLPSTSAQTTADGTVVHKDLQYENDLLCFWPNYSVDLCWSSQASGMVWVALDGELFCSAQVCKFRHHDETTRQSRLWR